MRKEPAQCKAALAIVAVGCSLTDSVTTGRKLLDNEVAFGVGDDVLVGSNMYVISACLLDPIFRSEDRLVSHEHSPFDASPRLQLDDRRLLRDARQAC